MPLSVVRARGDVEISTTAGQRLVNSRSSFHPSLLRSIQHLLISIHQKPAGAPLNYAPFHLSFLLFRSPHMLTSFRGHSTPLLSLLPSQFETRRTSQSMPFLAHTHLAQSSLFRSHFLSTWQKFAAPEFALGESIQCGGSHNIGITEVKRNLWGKFGTHNLKNEVCP